MSRTIKTLALLATCSLAIAPRALHAQAQAPTEFAPSVAVSQSLAVGFIGGQVTDSRGFGLGGAHVDITDAATGSSVEALTGADGRFEVGGLIVGHRYSMLVRRIGFAPRTDVSVPVSAVGLDRPGAVTHTVTLVPIADGYVGMTR